MRWKSTRLSCLIVICIVGLFSLGLAQQASKIGVVNSQQVLERSEEGKKAIARLQELDKTQQDKISKLDEEIRQLETKLNTQRLTLTNEAILQLTSDLDRKRTDRKRQAEDAMRELQDLRLRLFQKVQTELLPIIEQIGKERGLELILDLGNSGAIYFDPAIDLTEEVIRNYNASKATKK